MSEIHDEAGEIIARIAHDAAVEVSERCVERFAPRSGAFDVEDIIAAAIREAMVDLRGARLAGDGGSS